MNSQWHRLLITPAALWGSQSWLRGALWAAFSRPSAGHEGSPMTHEPPERRLRARLPAPRLFSRKAPPCAPGLFGGAGFSLPIRAPLRLFFLGYLCFRLPCSWSSLRSSQRLCVSAGNSIPPWFLLRLGREGFRRGARHFHHSFETPPGVMSSLCQAQE
jgi:hypothetical protein